MEFVDFKTDKMGETQITIPSGKFKGYTILIRTSVASIVFNDQYDQQGRPAFGITHTDNILVIPPRVDIRKQML